MKITPVFTALAARPNYKLNGPNLVGFADI